MLSSLASRRLRTLAVLLAAGACVSTASAETPPGDLAPYFGFDPPRFVVIDDGFEITDVADVTGDGLADLVVVNNRKSRIEIHAARREPQPETQSPGTNRLGASPWYDRIEVTVAQQVQAVKAVDLDGDGRLDLVYAGAPAEIITLRQTESGAFEPMSRRRVRGVGATRSGFDIADVQGDRGLEIVTLVDGRVAVLPLGADGSIGEPSLVGQGEPVLASYVGDFNGDGHTDILGVSPESVTPLRVWLQERTGRRDGALGAELRFESPPLREADPVNLRGFDATAIAVIERPTRRIVLHELVRERVDLRSTGGEPEAPIEIRAFANPSAASRGVAVADVDADGLADLLATDPAGNRVELWLQQRGGGFVAGETFSSFKKPSGIAVGPWDEDPALEVFVVSEEENVVGVSDLDTRTGRLSFPVPVALTTSGGTPTAIAATSAGTPRLAVAVKDRRDIIIEVHTPAGTLGALTAPGLRRAPDALRWADADQDGDPDVLVLTEGEPLVLIRCAPDGTPEQALGKEDMRQFGLVSAAGARNTAMLDLTGDGLPELLIADANFVRACRYDADAGWVVVEQITDADAGARYVGVDVMYDRARPRLVVADATGTRLKMYDRTDGTWQPAGSAGVRGFPLGEIHAGSFDGDGGPGVLLISGTAFASALLSGERWTLRELGAHRNDDEDRLEHEIAVGDINADGYTDLIVLDAQRQMVQILTVAASGALVHATEFQAFETRSFGFENSRGFEPRHAVIADATADGTPDLLLIVHDRIIVHPQATTAPEHGR